jgi:hypothetical protein
MMPTTEDLIIAASHLGFSVEELIQAEAKLQEEDKVSHSPLNTAVVRCPRAGKINPAITRGRSLKHQFMMRYMLIQFICQDFIHTHNTYS